MGWMKDETGLGRTEANFVPLTPLSHLKRAAHVFPDREAVVYHGHRKTYAEYHARVSQLASALVNIGVEPGDVVASILPNIPAHCEAHFGVPAAGGRYHRLYPRSRRGAGGAVRHAVPAHARCRARDHGAARARDHRGAR